MSNDTLSVELPVFQGSVSSCCETEMAFSVKTTIYVGGSAHEIRHQSVWEKILLNLNINNISLTVVYQNCPFHVYKST